LEKYRDQWLNIPLEQVPARVAEVPRDKPVYVYCNTGTRSYEVQRYLNTQGLDNVLGVQGSYAVLKDIAPEFDPREES
jgi:rhodanese-related sulfurtransferase